MKTVYDISGNRHDFTDDFSDADITRALSPVQGSPPTPETKLLPGPKWVGNVALPTRSQLTNFGLDMIPQAAGVAGAIYSGPLGAPIGQLAGRGIELGIKKLAGMPGVPETPQALGVDLTGAAGEGAMNEFGGKLLGGVGKIVGKKLGGKLLERSVNPSPTLLSQFPDVMQTIADRKLNVGDVAGKGGSQVAADLRSASGRVTKNLLKKAGAAGHTIDPVSLMPDVPQMVAGLPGDVDRGAAADQLHNMIGNFLDNYSGPMSPSEVKFIKQIHQRATDRISKAEAMGGIPSPSEALAMQFRKHVAGSSQHALENLPKYGKSIAKQEANTKSLIGAQRALKATELRPGRAVTIPYLPPALSRWIPAEARTAPNMSQAANSMNTNLGWLADPAMQAFLRQTPRGVDLLTRLGMAQPVNQ